MLFKLLLFLGLASPSPSFTQTVIAALPTWEADVLAQYEQPELIKVCADLAEEEVDEDQLRVDWNALETMDKILKTRMVI